MEKICILHIVSLSQYERSRRKVHARVRSVGAQDCVSATDLDLQELRADVRALQRKMSELKMKSSSVSKEGANTKSIG